MPALANARPPQVALPLAVPLAGGRGLCVAWALRMAPPRKRPTHGVEVPGEAAAAPPCPSSCHGQGSSRAQLSSQALRYLILKERIVHHGRGAIGGLCAEHACDPSGPQTDSIWMRERHVVPFCVVFFPFSISSWSSCRAAWRWSGARRPSTAPTSQGHPPSF